MPVRKKIKKAARRAGKKTAKKAVKKIAKRASNGSRRAGADDGKQTAKRKRLMQRRRAIRMERATSNLTNVNISGASNTMKFATRPHIFSKRREIGVFPLDKNVMIKQLIRAGSVENLAVSMGTTKAAVKGWFTRRGLTVQDVIDQGEDRKKEII